MTSFERAGVKNGFARAALLTAALFFWASAAASADPMDVTFAVTVNALNGHHEINGGHSDRLVFAPLPLGELTLRRNAESLRIEGLPPVTFGYNNSGDGALSTQLAVVTATYRHTFAGGWFAGAGQTVYNQFTTYVPVKGNFFYTRGAHVDVINGSEAQYSRVTGIRLEVGRTVQHGRDRIEWWAAANPRLRGIQYTRIPTVVSTCIFPIVNGGTAVAIPAQCSPAIHTYADPENGSQVDIAARVAHRLSKNGEVLVGLRYLNYTAHYDDFPGQLADRNLGFAPVLGYRIRL